MSTTDFKVLSDGVEVSFPLAVHAPYDERVDYYLNSRVQGLGNGYAVPMEYSDWRSEVMSWKEGCYIHAGLNDAATLHVKGPDAQRFFMENSVNSYATTKVGAIKHCIMCNDAGLIMTHGVLLKLAEDEFEGFFLAPWAAYKLFTGGYDATGEFITNQVIYQVAGPRSLEVLEAACEECLHDIAFGRFRTSSIAGVELRVARVGMAGTLAYELHVNKASARVVYEAVLQAGDSIEVPVTKLGFYAYQLSHTEDGFPQGFMHFAYPWAEDAGFMEWMGNPQMGGSLGGSVGFEMHLRYRNPVELGWAKTINFDHDFTGRAALEQEVANPSRTMVTLEWNVDDLLAVERSQYEPGEHYLPMTPSHFGQVHGAGCLYADKVFVGDTLVGVSSGRNYSYFYRRMISLCSLDTEYAAPGTEVTVLWGNSHTRQKKIRATVARFPYLTEERNEKVDVKKIPCRFA